MSDETDEPDDEDVLKLMKDLAPNDHELFDLSDVKIEIYPTKCRRKVSVLVKADSPMPDMKLYLILARELHRMERYMGITDDDSNLQ